MRINTKTVVVLLNLLIGCGTVCFAVSENEYVSHQKVQGGFCIAEKGDFACLYVDLQDFAGVQRAVGDLQADIERVTGHTAGIVHDKKDLNGSVVLVGTVGKSEIVDQLIKDGKIDVTEIEGKWESSLIQVVSEPIPGVSSGLVIVGSDKRGTIYGIYDLSEQMGVSPWYWWADVPVRRQENLYVKPGCHITGEPAVKYRGIFINDEEPCFGPWAREKFGGINSTMYVHMFELILRLRGNYLWPAMWGKSIYEDDPDSAALADEYGIVLGTSHHEPMTRAQKDWTRARNNYGNGEWNYATNEEGLKKFWREGMERNKDHEVLVTLGMRGDGDEPMVKGGDMEDNIKLLEKIIVDQRAIIKEIKGDTASEVPLMWALYKEVKDYYDHGMKVPDDITLLWCDDNWGNIRRLPTPQERKRSGGAGIYYHFDYVGSPRCYKWINTNPLPKIWEQMNMAYEYGADRIWVVNVGDLKPMEIPIDFFLTLAWDPSALPKEKIGEYTRQWAQQQFGPEYAEDIAGIVSKYAQYNGWRKPELLTPDTFSQVNFREAERVLAAWQEITAKAEKINAQLPSEYRDAFFQLVLHPTKASAAVAEIYIATGRNRLYAAQGRASANKYAQRVRELFKLDKELTKTYHAIADGKWNYMMAQTKMGYTSWRDPKSDVMPNVIDPTPQPSALLGVAIEGSESAWPVESKHAILPAFDSLNQQTRWIDVFKRGSKNFSFSVSADKPWVQLSETGGSVDQDQRIWVSVDWDKMPVGEKNAVVTISCSGGKSVQVHLNAIRSGQYTRQNVDAFGGLTGPTAINAESARGNVAVGGMRWEKIPGYGRHSSGMAVFPVTAESVMPPKDSPRMEYPVFVAAGDIQIDLITGISLDVQPGRGLRIAVSVDDGAPQILDAFEGQYYDDPSKRGDISSPAIRNWDTWVRDNARTIKSTHHITKSGVHTLKVWMVDPGVVLETIVVHEGQLPESYFGPPASCGKRGNPQAVATKSVEGAFATKQYRNLFVEAGYSAEAVEKKVSAVFEQLFHGDPEDEAVYFSAGMNKNGPLAYICDIHNNDVRSEGMSYGMMAAVQLDKKEIFDSLWNWAKTYMYHGSPDHPAYGYFSWSMKIDGKAIDEMPAPDGEEYFVTALYFAAHRWGNGTGIYGYTSQANQLLSDMKNRKLISGETVTGHRTAGSLFDIKQKMVRFTPDTEHLNHTDPSYHLPAFYELWALWGPETDRIFWAAVAKTSRKYLIQTTHPASGLSPDYGEFDGSPWGAPWRPESIEFQTDAWRTAMNWSFDWAWWGKDLRQCELSDRLQSFFESQGMNDYVNCYTIDGVPASNNRSTGLVAMNAVASLAATHPRSKAFTKAFWEAPVPTGQYRYYDGMLYMLGMLHCSGNFRIWTPDTIDQYQ